MIAFAQGQRVVLTKSHTFACMTHGTADQCVHVDIAREYLAEHPELRAECNRGTAA